jgi:integrase
VRVLQTIELGKGVIDRLRAQLGLIDLLRKMTRDKWQDRDLVFLSLVDTPIQVDRVSHEFPALVRKAGLQEIRFHDCRHIAASIMLSHGIPPIIVAGMLGHSLRILRSAMLTLSQGPRMRQLAGWMIFSLRSRSILSE